MRFVRYFPVLLMLAAGQRLAAQSPSASARAADPLSELVANADPLQLTGGQVLALQGIQDRLRARNAPLMLQLRDAGALAQRFGYADGQPEARHPYRQRRAMARLMDQVAPVQAQLRDNALEAVREVHAVLTPAQLAHVQEYYRSQGRDVVQEAAGYPAHG